MQYLKLAYQWGIGPDYCKRLLRWAAEILPYAAYDENNGILSIMTVTEAQGDEITVEEGS